MAEMDQKAEWEAFVAKSHAEGKCEFSGMRVSQCVRTICDCFETPEGAAAIERKVDGHVCAECPDCLHEGHQCCGCYDGACCKEGRRQQEALAGLPGYCRQLNDERTFMCDLPTGHDGEHSGFELPTVTFDEEF